MDYRKKYPLLRHRGECVEIFWERGYRAVEVVFRGRILATPSAAQLKKGFRFFDDELGNVELKFSEKPIAIDVIVDGFHSPANISYPKKNLTSASRILWVIAAFAGIVTIMELGSITNYPMHIIAIVAAIDLVFVGGYVVSSILVGKGRPWAYFLGYCLFGLSTLWQLYIFIVYGIDILAIIVFIARCMILIFLSAYLKTAIAAYRHARYDKTFDASILDNFEV